MRKLIKVNGQVVTAPFVPVRSMRDELTEKGGVKLFLEAAGLFGFMALVYGSLLLINAYYGG